MTKKNYKIDNNNGLLKNKKTYMLANNITSLILNALGLGGIMAAIGLDVVANADAATVLTTAGIGMGVGILGITSTIIGEALEKKISSHETDEHTHQGEDINCSI
ncbi:MAG: hypothetical protein J6A28_00365 [Clostridia bacterium]|nr:hypothetical protein [Clostridia bacterium]